MGSGAGEGSRTLDLLLGKQTLCRLSYSRSAYAYLQHMPAFRLDYKAYRAYNYEYWDP